MIVTKNPAVTFWHIPKTGGESVEAWFKENKIQHQLNSKNAKHRAPRTSSKKGHIYWGTVRNPYKRHASMYRYKCMKESANKGKNAFRKAYPTFESFCLETNKQFKGVKPMEPQWHYAQHFDIILRLESIKKDFKKIQNLYDCWEPLPQVNVSTEFVIDTTYNQEMKDAVYKRYSIDFEKLGYRK